MALTDESNGGIPATMLVSPSNMGGAYPYPVYQNGGGGNNGGFGDGNGWWVILLIIVLLAAGGWGNNGNGNGGGGVFGGQPIIVNDGGNNGGAVQRGFDQAAIMTGIGAIQTGVQNLSTQLCNCCGDMQMAIAQGFAGVEQGANARQIANMQQAFNSQIATMQGFNGVQSQNADIRATILQENCQDRYEASNNARDIIANATANTQALLNSNQRIMDKLCDQELQAERRENQNLRSELMYARGQASQIDQTAQIRAGQNATMTALVNELRSCPIPSQPVYGNQPIFTCSGPVWNNNGCGCGCNGGSF